MKKYALYDNYETEIEPCELICTSDDYAEIKVAAKQRIKDTDGECSLIVVEIVEHEMEVLTMYKFNPRCLTITERKEVEYLRDMLNGNINRMCVTDDLVELHNNATYALKEINRIIDIATDRFSYQTQEK